ncbi:MAG TPA: DUF5602 domain-containing protein [Gemmatimonadales bacterium]|nr:DUF5602 domain-containing protein [Gemmatimonadales bacterium]
MSVRTLVTRMKERSRPALVCLGAMAPLAALPLVAPLTAPAARTTYGPAVAVGGGAARVYVTEQNGAPTEVGVALSRALLASLPADGAPGGITMPDGHSTHVWLLPMPAGNPTPYRFVAFDWNPAGHMPHGTYDRPHFDFHFFTATEAERAAIVPTDSAFGAKSARHPAPELVPAGYVRLPGEVPLMGAHWADSTSPELAGAPFTETFLYGTWDGRLIFAEPMVTKAFLETATDFRRPIAVPARYAQPGWYPTEYRVYRDASSGEYRVALAGLVARR